MWDVDFLKKARTIWFLGLVCFASSLFSCDATQPPPNNPPPNNPPPSNVVDNRAKVPEAPKSGEGMQFVQPDFVVPAGQEKMICWIPNWIPEKDYHVTKFVGHQGKMGHHVVALSSAVPRKAGETFDCTDLEQMTTVEPLILPDTEGRVLLPEGHAVLLKKDTKIVIQSHYVNTTEKDVKVADVAQFYFYTKPEKPIMASYLIVNHGGINIQPGTAELKVSCPIKKEMELILTLGHMHEWGTSLDIYHERGKDKKMLYEVKKWLVEHRDNPPITFFPELPNKTFKLMPGDAIHLTCRYNNTTKKPLRFPSEMCVMVGYYRSSGTTDLIKCDVD